jgi:histidinol-phosphate/aromatic aminotransferase/cobyric acid decarboxylase-like protein
MPVTALVAASASLKHTQLVPDRKLINTTVREKTFDWLKSQGYSFTPSQANFFMLDTKRPVKEVISAMAAQKVFIGRPWPVWPTWARITVGTQPEMDAFQTAFAAVMKNSVSVSYALPIPQAGLRDGVLVDGQLLTGFSS